MKYDQGKPRITEERADIGGIQALLEDVKTTLELLPDSTDSGLMPDHEQGAAQTRGLRCECVFPIHGMVWGASNPEITISIVAMARGGSTMIHWRREMTGRCVRPSRAHTTYHEKEETMKRTNDRIVSRRNRTPGAQLEQDQLGSAVGGGCCIQGCTNCDFFQPVPKLPGGSLPTFP